MRKDLLILCQYFYPEYNSSAMLPYEMAVDLIKNGVQVDVLCGYPKEYLLEDNVPTSETLENIGIKRLKYWQLKRTGKVGRLLNNSSFLIAVLLRFFRLRKYKCIMVYSNPPLLPIIPALAAKIFNSKVIFVSYDVYPDVALVVDKTIKGGIIEKINNWVNSVVFKNITKVVALSSDMKQYLLEHRQNLNSETVEIIPNWYDDPPEIRDKKISNTKIAKIRKQGRTVVLYSGNMGLAQDMDTILSAINKLKNHKEFLFILAGHGSKIDEIKEYLDQNKISNTLLLDFLHGSDFTDILKIADCNLVSLVNGVEGLGVPSKTYSYMAAGKPIIAIMSENTDIARDLYDYDMGFCIRQGDSDALVNILKKLNHDRILLEYMGANSRRAFEEKYTRPICTQKYYKLIRSLLNES